MNERRERRVLYRAYTTQDWRNTHKNQDTLLQSKPKPVKQKINLERARTCNGRRNKTYTEETYPISTTCNTSRHDNERQVPRPHDKLRADDGTYHSRQRLETICTENEKAPDQRGHTQMCGTRKELLLSRERCGQCEKKNTNRDHEQSQKTLLRVK